MPYTNKDVKELAYMIYISRLNFPGLGDPSDEKGIWKEAENQLWIQELAHED